MFFSPGGFTPFRYNKKPAVAEISHHIIYKNMPSLCPRSDRVYFVFDMVFFDMVFFVSVLMPQYYNITYYDLQYFRHVM